MMKKVTKKVLALAMGLFLTVGAMAQMQSLPTNQNNTGNFATKADVKMGQGFSGQLATSPKGGHVNVTIDSMTSRLVYVSFDMDDTTAMYLTLFTNAGLKAAAEAQGATLAQLLANLYSQPQYQSYFTLFTQDTSFGVQGFTPGDTGAVYVLAFNGQQDANPSATETDFIVPVTGGGSGVAAVSLQLGYDQAEQNITVTVTPNDQTAYYYMAIGDSAALAEFTEAQLISGVIQNGSSLTEGLNGVGLQNPAQGTTYYVGIVPFNGNAEQGTYNHGYIYCGVRQGGGSGEGISSADAMGLSIYPNPATDQMNVSANNIERVELYNAMGQKVETEAVSGNVVRINVSDLTKGAYVVKIYANGTVATQKVIVK